MKTRLMEAKPGQYKVHTYCYMGGDPHVKRPGMLVKILNKNPKGSLFAYELYLPIQYTILKRAWQRFYPFYESNS